MGRSKILCADCGADLSQVTGSPSHESSACPFCGHQTFERWRFDGTLGPGAENDDAGGEA